MGTLSVPLKTIIMYHADATNEPIPSSYEACDGRLLGIGTHDIGGGTSTYQLPDLRNRFILGADITKGVGITGGLTDAAADAPGPKGVSGLNGTTLTTAQLPSHTHTGTSASSGAHTHSITDLGHTHSIWAHTAFGNPSVAIQLGTNNHDFTDSGTTVQSATTGITINSGGAHTHTFTTDATGTASIIDNRPRFYGLIFLMKCRL